MSEKEQKDGSAALGLQRTETKESLEDLGISDKSPPLDVNYPEVGRAENPEFPEEYTIETKTGLVPESALKQESVNDLLLDDDEDHHAVSLAASFVIVYIAYSMSIATDFDSRDRASFGKTATSRSRSLHSPVLSSSVDSSRLCFGLLCPTQLIKDLNTLSR
ncbi:hypothetical protein CBS147332_3707 [Penicillium roqueforti]|nr:hypothetical protein CBS147332_3707 [Penicillium roqueforti]KAI3117495.1 hypothetical protein CBS147331_3970 [Penicillium roqueforti]